MDRSRDAEDLALQMLLDPRDVLLDRVLRLQRVVPQAETHHEERLPPSVDDQVLTRLRTDDDAVEDVPRLRGHGLRGADQDREHGSERVHVDPLREASRQVGPREGDEHGLVHSLVLLDLLEDRFKRGRVHHVPKASEGPDGGLAGLNLSAVNLMGGASERPEEFVHGERRIHRVRALFHTGERLLVRHPRSRDPQTDGLARPQSDVEEGPRHDRHERLVVEGLAFDHRADGNGPVDVRAFEEPLDRERNLERAGHADHGRHSDASLLRAREGLLHHSVRHLAMELRGHDREPHRSPILRGPASEKPSRCPVPARARIASGRNRRSYAFTACSRVRRSKRWASSTSSDASSSWTITPRMCRPTFAWTAWRPKSAASAQSLSTGCRPTMPRARTRSQPRSKRIRAPAARSLIPGTVYRSMTKPPRCFRSSAAAAARLTGLRKPGPRLRRRHRLVFEPPRRAVPRDHDPNLVAELPRLTQEIEVTGMEEIEDPRRHYTDHKRHARTMSWPSRNTRFLSRAYAFASSLERARPSSDIISQMVAVGASPAMIMRAVVSSVCPRRSSKSGSAAFSKETWPGERNSSAKAWASYPFSRFTASFAIAASRAIVFARSTSVTPVNVSRWLTAMEKALCRSYLKSSAETASRTGYAGPARRSTSVMKGRPIRAWTSPDTVMQIRPPASLRRVRIPAGVTNSLAIVRSVSASRPSPS